MPHFISNFYHYKAICIKMNMIKKMFVSNTIYVFLIKNDDIFSNIFSEMFHDLLKTSHKIYAITQSYSLNSSNLFFMILCFFVLCINWKLFHRNSLFFFSFINGTFAMMFIKTFSIATIFLCWWTNLQFLTFFAVILICVKWEKICEIKIQLKFDLCFFNFLWIIRNCSNSFYDISR